MGRQDMTRDIETTVWCPECREDHFRVVRVPTGQTGVFENKMEVLGQALLSRKTCRTCGGPLSRKETDG